MKTEKGKRKKITHFCPRELPMELRTSSLGPAHPIPDKEDPRTQQGVPMRREDSGKTCACVFMVETDN